MFFSFVSQTRLIQHNAEISSDMSLTSAGNTVSMQETALSQAESLRLP